MRKTMAERTEHAKTCKGPGAENSLTRAEAENKVCVVTTE